MSESPIWREHVNRPESLEELYRRMEAEIGDRIKASFLDGGLPYGVAANEPRLWRDEVSVDVSSVDEIKDLLNHLVRPPAINVGRGWGDALLVMPRDLMSHAMEIRPEMFVENLSEPTPYRFMHQFNYMPVYTNRFLFSTADMTPDRPPEPVLPRLMAEHVPEVKQKDLSFWQAMVCVVVLGWILVSLGGAL